ncbi:MAG: RNA methyltransferase substrate-binding domain-containing protein, partial [Bacteroidales bacterium]
MKKDNDYLIYGIRPMIEAIKGGKEIEKVMLQSGTKGELMQELSALLKEHQIISQFVPIEKLNRMCVGNHQGVVGFIS